MLTKLTRSLLFVTLAAPPFIVAKSLFFPFVSGKAYLFRLLVLLSFFVWIVLMIKQPRYRPNFKNLLVISTLLFLAGLIIAAFLGVDTSRSFFSNFERGDGVIQFGFWVLYFLMLISILKNKKDWQIFLGVFLTVALIISIYAWFNRQTQPSLYGVFGNPAYLAGFLIFAVGFTVVFLKERVSFGEKYFPYLNFLLFPLILFFILTLIFTQIRGAYAGLGAGFVLLTILAFLFLRKEKKKLTICLSAISIVGLIFIGLIFVYRESDFVKSRPMLKRTTDIVEVWQTASVKERLLTWQTALKAFKDRPIFGWGPENFDAAFNKYYDYRVGLDEPWFDRVHNQSLQYLADGGLFLFSLYLFWLFSVFYLISKIFKKKKLLAAILASTYLAYLVQGLFLFDVFPIRLGLFTFFGFVYFSYQSIYSPEELSFSKDENKRKNRSDRFSTKTKLILVVAFCLVGFLICTTVWLPYKANSLALKYYAYLVNGRYEEAQSFLEQAVEINSPYTLFSIRKRGGWNFLTTLDNIDEETRKEDIESITKLYKFITPELEKAVNYHPFDAQIYFISGKVYRLGFEKLGQNDLDKAENILKKSLNYSQYRVEYFNELALVLVLEKKFEEAENLIHGYVENIEKTNPGDPFPYVTLGHLYFVEERYDLAMPQYQKAKGMGYEFWKNPIEYNRYLKTAEELKDYQKVVEICQEYLTNLGSDADAFFNLAVSYLELKDYQKAKEFFEKALELNSELEEYRIFFENF